MGQQDKNGRMMMMLSKMQTPSSIVFELTRQINDQYIHLSIDRVDTGINALSTIIYYFE